MIARLSGLLTVLGTLLLMNCSKPPSDLEKIELRTLAGDPIDMGDFKDKIVFVNFWATWCKPCIQEMPTIAKAQEQLKDENVVFIFPSDEDVDLINHFKEVRKFDFNFVRAQNTTALAIQALPTTFIFNKKGDRIFAEAGFRDWSTPESIALITGN